MSPRRAADPTRGGKPQLYCSTDCRTKAKQGFKKARHVSTIKTCALPGCEITFPARTAKRFCCVEHRALARNCCRCDAPIPGAPGTKTRYCRDCEAELRRARRLDPLVKAIEVSAQRLAKYGITAEQYEEMNRLQGGRCLICGQAERGTRRGIPKTLAVDHDHDTGEIRGLLCSKCNTAIGLLDDDPKRARAVARYLDRPPAGPK